MPPPPAATLAAVVVLALVAVALWARAAARVRPRDLAGFWGSPATGETARLDPGPGRTFVVSRAAGGAAGILRGAREACILGAGSAPARCGRVEPGARRINWGGGSVWTRLGVE